MGRPPSNGGPTFRFNQAEVAEMEALLQAHNAAVPAREVLVSLAEKFSASAERSGKVTVQMKQVWNWFQNRRYAIRAKAAKSPGKLTVSPMHRDDSATLRNVPQAAQLLSVPSAAARALPQPSQHPPAPSVQSAGRNASENSQMEYEAKSARDGAWYDVATFLSHRSLGTGDPEVLVRFAGFGQEEDEWVNVRNHVRQRSLPCESSECVAVLPADLILCFQEGKEQALYFDAHVLDAQRRRHDVRGCRCRFLVRYDHDQSEEIVALRKICRRPETDYRLQQLHAVNESANVNQNKTGANIHTGSTLRVYPPAEVTIKPHKVETVVSASHTTTPQYKVQQHVTPGPALMNAPPVMTEVKVQMPKIESGSVNRVGNSNRPQENAAQSVRAATTVTGDSKQSVPQESVKNGANSNDPPENAGVMSVTAASTVIGDSGQTMPQVSFNNLGNSNQQAENTTGTSVTAASTVTGDSCQTMAQVCINNVGNSNEPPENTARARVTAANTGTDDSGQTMPQVNVNNLGNSSKSLENAGMMSVTAASTAPGSSGQSTPQSSINNVGTSSNPPENAAVMCVPAASAVIGESGQSTTQTSDNNVGNSNDPPENALATSDITDDSSQSMLEG